MNEAQLGGMPVTEVRKGCCSKVAALGRAAGAFTRQLATKALKSCENAPSSCGGGFYTQYQHTVYTLHHIHV